MTYRGPYTPRAPRRRRGYGGPAGNATAWSSGSFIILILAIVAVALAIAYGVNG